MINVSTAVGRLTKDVEIRKAGDKNVASYQIACQRPYKKDNGEKPVDFIQCVTWGNDADFLAKNTKKGAFVSVTGRLDTRSYDHSQYPIKVYVTEINTSEVQVLDWNEDQQPQGGYQQPPQQGYNQGGYQQPPQGGYNQGGYQQPQGGYQQQYQQPPQNQQYNQGGYQQPANLSPHMQQQLQGGQQPNTYQQPPATHSSNYTRVEEDPFSRGTGPIEVNDDDLPF